MASPYKYNRIDLAKDAIRLVRLLGGDQSQPIRCEIFETYLHQIEGVPYEALSYVWGSRQSADKIWLEGCLFEVTENLYQALAHLRRPHEDRVLWVDALCIDQSHDAERGHQVGQMRLVYQNAQRVIVWLGTSDSQADCLFDWMDTLDKQVLALPRPHTIRTWESQWLWVIWHQRGTYYPPDDLREALRVLLRRDWFSRIWVLQEAALAKSAIIVCGRNEVNSRAFVVMPSLLRLKCDEADLSRLDILPGLLRATSWWGDGSSKSLDTLIQKFGRSKASDPRDIIYALLGLSEDAHSSEFLRPNYQIGLQEAIQQSVAYFMMQAHNLPEQAQVQALPRWSMDEFLDALPNLALSVFTWAMRHAQDGLLYDLFMSQREKQEGQLIQRYMNYAADRALDTPLLKLLKSERREERPQRTPHYMDYLSKNAQSYLVSSESKREKRKHNTSEQHWVRELRWHSTNHGPPLTVAVKKENLSLVELLLQFPDVDIETEDLCGNTPYSIAVGQGNTFVANLILQRTRGQHDVHGGGDSEHEPPPWVTHNNRLRRMVRRHFNHVKPDSPLLTSIKRGDLNAVHGRMGRDFPGEQRDLIDSNGDGILNIAAQRGDQDILDLVLERSSGSSHFIRGSDGLTPLESSLVAGAPATIAKLLDNRKPAVHEAVRSNQFDFVRRILDVRPELADHHWLSIRTPLAAAAWAGNARIMSILLDKGANIDLRDSAGRSGTPLWIAAARGDLRTVQLLVERGADLELTAEEFPTKKAFDVDRFGPHYTPQDGLGSENTRAKPIWVAASLGYTDVVRFLIQRGADVDGRDSYYGLTPFWRAAQQNRPDVMRVLIEGGANVRVNRLVGWGRWRINSGGSVQ